MVLLAALNSST